MVALSALGFIAGLVLLVIGAEGLVRGGSDLARRIGMSPLLVGLTVVAFGTSAPELVVSATASWQGNGAVAVGNVVGSNILNILMVLAFTAMVCPIPIRSRMIRTDMPVLLLVTAIVWLMAATDGFSRFEGVLLLLALIAYMFRMFRQERGRDYMPFQREDDALAGHSAVIHAEHGRLQTLTSILFLLAGIGLLVLGANWVVDHGIVLAAAMGIPDHVVAVTLVAFGTSAPELATSLVAASKGKVDLAIGNAVGSNFLNLYMVLGASALIRPIAVERDFLLLDFPVMVLATMLLLRFATQKGRLHKTEGALFLALYGVYAGLLLAGWTP